MTEPLPFGGAIVDKRHHLPVRVYYEDTDAAGIVYYANYLKFMERGRTDFLRLLDVEHGRLIAGVHGQPIGFVVRRAEVDYLAPARLGDLLAVVTGIVSCTGATVTMAQVVRRDDTVLAKGLVKAAVIGQDGRPRPLPRPIRHIFNTLVCSDAPARG